MLFSVFEGLLYLAGLLLLLMPPRHVPFLKPGSGGSGRVIKHGVALVLFAAGTVRIHRAIYERAGNRFLVASCLLVLVIGLFRVWQEKSGG